ncbi:MAG: COG4280 domain-containing protein [Acidimicrobiales bacterium]
MFAATSVSSGVIVLVGAVFLACAVEMVEALTIVLAVGHTRGWRSALEGTVVALVALAALVAAFGPALVHIPLSVLRLVVGGVLLIFGMQWLRKAILRSSGLKAMHDEDAIYKETVAELEAISARPDRDRIAFVMAFKGVFLEGLEVVITVLTLGTSAHRLGLAVVTAGVAIVLVGVTGAIVAKQLSNVPENAMKMGVGILLVSYGTFWVGEGLKVTWPGNDGALLGLVGLYAVVSWLLIVLVRPSRGRVSSEVSA